MQVEILDVRVETIKRNRTRVSLACLDEAGVPQTIEIHDFQPYVLLVPKSHKNTSAWLESSKEMESDDVVLEDLLPLCGFVRNPCRCMKVYGATDYSAKRRAWAIQDTLKNEKQLDSMFIDAYKMQQLFFLETGTRPQSWIQVPSNTARMQDITVLEIAEHAPIMQCVFDLECHSSTGGFPNAAILEDRIEIIGAVFTLGGKVEKVCLVREDHVQPLKDTTVETFAGNEMHMLLAFRNHIVKRRTTVVIAHNGFGFDMPFLYSRLDTLVRHDEANSNQRKAVQCLSCFRPREPVEIKCRTMRHQHIEFEVGLLFPFGVAFVDSITYFRKMFTLSSYGLNAIGEHFLNEKKHDVSPGFMFKVFGHNPCVGDLSQALTKVVEYCMQDVILTLRVCERVKMLLGLFGLCRVTLTPLNEYMTSGQQVKSYHCISKKCFDMGYYINKDDLPEPRGSYPGATVLEPSIGFHQEPVMCLDFASLYPTCIVAFNLCFSTIEWRGEQPFLDETISEEERDKYTLNGTSVSFVNSTVRQGVIPSVVDELMAERKTIKERMKKSSGVEREVLDKLQWAIKITQNSIYGFMGVQGKRDEMTGDWIFKPMLANGFVAEAVTWNGRRLIHDTCRLIKENYDDAVIVYGGTLSRGPLTRRQRETLSPKIHSFLHIVSLPCPASMSGHDRHRFRHGQVEEHVPDSRGTP